MRDAPSPAFGLLIAYVIPGFVLLWGLSFRLQTVNSWLNVPPNLPAGLESAFFITLASVAAGMIVSAARWCLVDSFHHYTGLLRPSWDDKRLQQNLDAFHAVVEAHYRYYQCHANLAVAIGASYLFWRVQPGVEASGSIWSDAGFLVVEALLVAISRDNLRKYYARTARILSPQKVK